jgi:uncharacterized membrane protein
MSFNSLCIVISSIFIGASITVISLSAVGKEIPPRLFDLAIASLGVLGALLVTPPRK